MPDVRWFLITIILQPVVYKGRIYNRYQQSFVIQAEVAKLIKWHAESQAMLYWQTQIDSIENYGLGTVIGNELFSKDAVEEKAIPSELTDLHKEIREFVENRIGIADSDKR